MNVFHQGLSLRLSWAEDTHNQLSQRSQASTAPGLCLELQQLQQHPESSQLYLGATHPKSLTTNVTAAWGWEEGREAGEHPVQSAPPSKTVRLGGKGAIK